mgnify:CR=1 FL=1
MQPLPEQPGASASRSFGFSTSPSTNSPSIPTNQLLAARPSRGRDAREDDDGSRGRCDRRASPCPTKLHAALGHDVVERSADPGPPASTAIAIASSTGDGRSVATRSAIAEAATPFARRQHLADAAVRNEARGARDRDRVVESVPRRSSMSGSSRSWLRLPRAFGTSGARATRRGPRARPGRIPIRSFRRKRAGFRKNCTELLHVDRTPRVPASGSATRRAERPSPRAGGDGSAAANSRHS